MGKKTRKIKKLEGSDQEKSQRKEGNHLGRVDDVIRLGNGVMEIAVRAIRVLGEAVMVVMEKSLGRTCKGEKDRDGKDQEKHPIPADGSPNLFVRGI
jgi:hypothetical protein